MKLRLFANNYKPKEYKMADGFKLYEIDAMLRQALDSADKWIDRETGEVPDNWARLIEDLQMSRDAKCLAVAAYIREQEAQASAIEEEVGRLEKRLYAAKNKASQLKQYLSTSVKVGEKLKDARVSIGWRKSERTIIDEKVLPDEYWKVERSPMKSAVKTAIECGLYVPGARIETHHSITIR
jgi:hypothetical protein